MATEPELAPEVEELPPPRPAALHLPMDGKHIPRHVAALALWPFLENMLHFLVSFVDTAIAGHLSVEATNGIGVASYVLWLMGLLIGAAAVGATAVIARAAGAQRWRRANQVLGQSMTLALLWGVAIGAIFLAVAGHVAGFSGLKGESLRLGREYLQLMALAAPFSTLLTVGTACLRGIGDTRSPFLVMILVNVVNASFSILFVADWSPIGGFGVRGIAMGTGVAWFAGCLAIVTVLVLRRHPMHLQRRFLLPRWPSIRRIVRVGIPNLLESSGLWVGNFIMISIVGHLPAHGAVGAHIVAVRLEALSYLPGFAVGTAAATLAGQYLGAGRPDLARKAIAWCWVFGASIMTALGVMFIVMPEPFVRIATDQRELLEAVPPLLTLAGCVQIGFATYLVFSHALRGAGDTRMSMIMTFASIYLVRVPLVYFLGVTLGYGLYGVWVALSIELMVRGTLFCLRFLFGNWASIKV